MEFDSGHHIYKEIWPNPNIGEQLHCKMEHGNIHDMYAVARVVAVTRDREDIVVGHLPRNISTPCHLFLRKGGNISCVVNGARRFFADLVQGGLEVPCRLVFQGSTRDIDKIRQMLQDVEVPVVSNCRSDTVNCCSLPYIRSFFCCIYLVFTTWFLSFRLIKHFLYA